MLGVALLFGACEIRFGEGVGPEPRCGSCNRANAVAMCEDQECVLVSCEHGFGDCNDWSRDGCETNLRDSRENCGVCGNRCLFCSAGVCEEPTQVADVGSSGLGRLAVDGTHVYWSTFAGALWRTPKGVAAPEQLASPGIIDALHVDETHLYWVSPGPRPALSTNVSRMSKHGGAPVEHLAVLERDVWTRHMVPHGGFLYFMPRSSGGTLVRVAAAGGTVERLPDLDGEGTISGLQARAQGVIFAYSLPPPGSSQLIEYSPAAGRFQTLDAIFLALSFAVDEKYAYFNAGPLQERAGREYALIRRSLQSGTNEEIGRSSVAYPYMMLDGDSLFLIDFERGSASTFDLVRRTTKVLFGEQNLLGNVAVDAEFLYYASSGRILRVRR